MEWILWIHLYTLKRHLPIRVYVCLLLAPLPHTIFYNIQFLLYISFIFYSKHTNHLFIYLFKCHISGFICDRSKFNETSSIRENWYANNCDRRTACIITITIIIIWISMVYALFEPNTIHTEDFFSLVYLWKQWTWAQPTAIY